MLTQPTTRSVGVLAALSIVNLAMWAMPAQAQRRVCVETSRGQVVCGRPVNEDDRFDNDDRFNDNSGSSGRCDISGFDEKFYLEAYSDVEAAIRQGRVRNACDHYKRNGRYEGRFPRFNEASYLSNNPDVAEAIRNKRYRNGYEHWQKYGRYENRKL